MGVAKIKDTWVPPGSEKGQMERDGRRVGTVRRPYQRKKKLFVYVCVCVHMGEWGGEARSLGCCHSITVYLETVETVALRLVSH